MVRTHGVSTVRMRSAFTLIELLVVVAILALLIEILLPSLAHARELSKRTIGGTRLKAVGQLVALYANEWNDVPPVGVRSFYGNTIGGSGTSGSGNMVRYMFKVTFTTVGNQPLWRWGAPLVLSNSTSGSNFLPTSPVALQAIWVSPGPNVENIFNAPLYGSPNSGTLWAHLQNKNAGGTKCFGFGSYFNFLQDPGNSVTPVFYQDAGATVLDDRFDSIRGSRGKFSQYASNQLIMQDQLYQDTVASGGFFTANFVRRPGGYVQETWGADGSKPLGAALGLASGAHAYSTGYYTVNSEADVAGANALTADGAVTWSRAGDMDKVYYVAPGTSDVRTLYLLKR